MSLDFIKIIIRWFSVLPQGGREGEDRVVARFTCIASRSTLVT